MSRTLFRHIKPTSLSYHFTHTRNIAMENSKGQGVSHASESSVPGKIQEKAPAKLEHELPDVSTLVHDALQNVGGVKIAQEEQDVESCSFSKS